MSLAKNFFSPGIGCSFWVREDPPENNNVITAPGDAELLALLGKIF